MSADDRVSQALQPDQFGVPRYTVKPKRRRRWWLITLTIIIALICLWWFWPRHDRMLQLAAELDQSDPGWRWDELRASQAKLAETENATPTLIKIGSAISAIPSGLGSQHGSHVRKKPGIIIWARIGDDLAWIGPTEPLNDDLARELTFDLQSTEAVRKQLPELLRFSAARNELSPFMQYFAGTPPSTFGFVQFTDLLNIELEAALMAGDEPFAQERACLLIHGINLWADYGRAYLSEDYFKSLTQARQRLERMLARVEGNEALLNKLQAELMRLDPKQHYRQWLRLQRASDFATYDLLANHSQDFYRERKTAWYGQLRVALQRNEIFEGQALLVEFFTYRLDQLSGSPSAEGKIKLMLVGLEKYRPEKNGFVQETWDDLVNSGFRYARNRIYSCLQITEPAYRQAQAAQQVMIAAIAAERFRLKNGRWPNDLHELVPVFLAEVPKDTCSPGNELRWKVTPTGRVVYSVGLNGTDDGGNCEWIGQDVMADVGFRLFDQRIHQKAKPSAPEPAYLFEVSRHLD